MAIPVIVTSIAKLTLSALKTMGSKAIRMVGSQLPKIVNGAKVVKVKAAASLSKGITYAGTKLAANVVQKSLKDSILKGTSVLASEAFTQMLVTDVALKATKGVNNIFMPTVVQKPINEILDSVDCFAGIPLI